MRCSTPLKKPKFRFVAFGWIAAVLAVGCTHAPLRSGLKPADRATEKALEKTSERAADRPAIKPRALFISRGITELKLLPEDPNLVNALDELMAQVRSEKVTLPAEALRVLVRTEKGRRSQLRDLSGQLEAIKNIDVQEAASSKQGSGGVQQ